MEKTTNLEKIKELALKYFDAHDISVEPMEALRMPPTPDGQEITLHEAHCHILPIHSSELFLKRTLLMQRLPYIRHSTILLNLKESRQNCSRM